MISLHFSHETCYCHQRIVLTDLEKNVEEKIQEIQSKGNEIVNVTMGGRGNESSEDWVALVLYEEK